VQDNGAWAIAIHPVTLGSVYQLHIVCCIAEICEAIKQLFVGDMLMKYCCYLLKGGTVVLKSWNLCDSVSDISH